MNIACKFGLHFVITVKKFVYYDQKTDKYVYSGDCICGKSWMFASKKQYSLGDKIIKLKKVPRKH